MKPLPWVNLVRFTLDIQAEILRGLCTFMHLRSG